jgi:forkhead box protein J2/3
MIPGAMRFPPPAPPPIPIPDGDIEVDEHGNVDWPATWHKELAHLQQVTSDQDKAQVDPEWYRVMLFRVRGALLGYPNPGEGPVVHVPGAMPSNPGEQQ